VAAGHLQAAVAGNGHPAVQDLVAGPADPEAGQVLGGQVDAAAGEVLGHVADEVGELEGQAELAGVLAGGGGLEDSRIGASMVPMTAAEPSM
jgi:hypothetical protein